MVITMYNNIKTEDLYSGPQCVPSVAKHCHKTPQISSSKVPRPVCRTVVDTTHVEECEDLVTQTCEETSQQIIHTSNVVAADTQVLEEDTI